MGTGGKWETLERSLFRSGFYKIYPNRKNRVLMYHSVGGGLYGNISQNQFREDIAYISKRCEIVDLPDVLKPSSSKRIALTFDDGFSDFYSHVLPILREFNVPATVFVLSESINNPEFTHNGNSNTEYMDLEELQELIQDDLVTIGNHTQTHPHLSECSMKRIEEEVIDSKNQLEEVLGITVDRFCYPHGDFDERVVQSVSASHKYAVTVGPSHEQMTPETNTAKIPRQDGSRPSWKVRWQLTDLASKLRKFKRKIVQF